MRDILTALAGAVILLLVAALAVPPFVAWEGYRGTIDRTIARSLGVAGSDRGPIGVRLLPSPRLKLDRLRLGDRGWRARRSPPSTSPARCVDQGRDRPGAAAEGRDPLHRDADRPGRGQAPGDRRRGDAAARARALGGPAARPRHRGPVDPAVRADDPGAARPAGRSSSTPRRCRSRRPRLVGPWRADGTQPGRAVPGLDRRARPRRASA